MAGDGDIVTPTSISISVGIFGKHLKSRFLALFDLIASAQCHCVVEFRFE